MNTEALDRYLPANMRAELETRFYARVNDAARIENTLHDPDLWSEKTHLTWFSDHGVIHVRDVATQILNVLDVTHGVLIPARPPQRFDPFMKTYGVLLSYLHDIGMSDFSPYGRKMHPQYAAQAVFSGELDTWVRQAWDENLGNIAWRLVNLERRGLLPQAPEDIFREMLALSMGHSKSKVPMDVLNEPSRLRAVLLRTLTTDLQVLHLDGPSAEAGRSGPYQADSERAFAWLVCDEPDCRELVDDVVDTVRALRCADALAPTRDPPKDIRRLRGVCQPGERQRDVLCAAGRGQAVFARALGTAQCRRGKHRQQ